jgi:hypothetical protein
MKVGQAVMFTDELGVERPALLTCVHGGEEQPAPYVNLVTISLEPNKTDQYGRQSEHFSSVTNESLKGTCPGRWYRPL